MDNAKKVFEEIFDVKLQKEDFNKSIKQVLDWDSFVIMNFMTEMEDRYGIVIDIIQISMIETGVDLLELIKQCINNER